MIKHINKEEFDKEVLTSKEIVLVDFYADWCGPCKMISPILEEIENINIYKINVDDEEDLTMQYGIMSIPCIIAFKDGKEYKRSIGLVDKNTIINLTK